MGRRTCLFDEHARLGGRLVDFHGWELPVQYEGILAEHNHCRRAAAVFDTSHMGQLLVRGAPAELGRLTTQNPAALALGRARYGFLLNEAGGILDDTILLRLDEGEFLLVVNAARTDADREWLAAHLPASAELVDLSAEGWGKLDLQGPASAEVLAPLADADLRSLGYFDLVRTRVCGRECVVSRTGYTGELGYELLAPGESVVEMFRRLIADPRVKPAGLGARDSLRLEMCYPLYGADIDAETTPFEAGLERFVRFAHEFIGSRALREPATRSPSRRLVPFVGESRRRVWPGSELWRDGRKVGTVTSGAFAPSLGVSVGMGYVACEFAAPGTRLTARTTRGDLAVTVAAKPLYKGGTCRRKEV